MNGSIRRGLAAGALRMAIVPAFLFLVSVAAHGQQMVLPVTNTGAGSITVPTGYDWINVTVQCWSGGGGGGGGWYVYGGGGGGGGAYAYNTYPTLLSGLYNYYIGAGGGGGASINNGSAGGDTIWNYGGVKIFMLRVVAVAIRRLVEESRV